MYTCAHEESYEENICGDLKNDSEGISKEENTWRYIGGISGQYFWKEIEGGSLGKYLGSISGHYIIFVDINSQTNILK
jgi:hypothetical protein